MPAGTQPRSPTPTAFSYDADGNIDLVTSDNGNNLDYIYDAANRLTQINDDPGNCIQYAYDTQGNLNREERKAPSGTTTYSYTNNGQLYQEIKTFAGLSGSFTTREGIIGCVRERNGVRYLSVQ